MCGARAHCTSVPAPPNVKAKNLSHNANCILTTGRNDLEDGLDVVLEGEATPVSDKAQLDRVAGAFELKYGSHLTAPAGTWFGLADAIRAEGAVLYRVVPSTIFGFGKGRTNTARPDGASANSTSIENDRNCRIAWRHSVPLMPRCVPLREHACRGQCTFVPMTVLAR